MEIFICCFIVNTHETIVNRQSHLWLKHNILKPSQDPSWHCVTYHIAALTFCVGLNSFTSAKNQYSGFQGRFTNIISHPIRDKERIEFNQLKDAFNADKEDLLWTICISGYYYCTINQGLLLRVDLKQGQVWGFIQFKKSSE